MTQQLREALARLDALPDSEQNELAARIEALLSEHLERRWEGLLADPRSEAFFDQMAERYDQAQGDGAFGPVPLPDAAE